MTIILIGRKGGLKNFQIFWACVWTYLAEYLPKNATFPKIGIFGVSAQGYGLERKSKKLVASEIRVCWGGEPCTRQFGHSEVNIGEKLPVTEIPDDFVEECHGDIENGKTYYQSKQTTPTYSPDQEDHFDRSQGG